MYKDKMSQVAVKEMEDAIIKYKKLMPQIPDNCVNFIGKYVENIYATLVYPLQGEINSLNDRCQDLLEERREIERAYENLYEDYKELKARCIKEGLI